MTYILNVVAIVNYNFVLRGTYVSYVLDMVVIVNYNFVLPEDLCDLHTGHGSDR